MTVKPDDNVEFYLAMAIIQWSKVSDSVAVAAKSVADALVGDWDCSDATRIYVLDAVPTLLARLHQGDKTAFEQAYLALDEFGPDEVAEHLDRCVAIQNAAALHTNRSLIDELIQQTNLYATSASFISLLEFVAKMRGFAPFNAMLLHAQKPGITHAATATDWTRKFNRTPKPDARPLIVLQVMGPVGFVFDILDTEGDDLPPDAFAFPTLGDLSAAQMAEIVTAIKRAKIAVEYVDKGDGAAGSVSRTNVMLKGEERPVWKIRLNQNHAPPVQFVTLAHELAHLFLGHLGADHVRHISARSHLKHDLQEVEAETVAWLVAHRNGLKPKSEAYLDQYKLAFKALDVATILRAANAVETAMGISAAQLAKVSKGEQNLNTPH
ncbi:ImmA/IrrE family metallo-endopeptidase [Cypionkella sp.]|uniref:ImmA/IrrE family metallo-endopeptidase n=1 Tax=Cypionkella sp. TaxID=2811411 RepID=UPI00271E6B8A|nr:ImmA/IrrE family metallo-endopeptidase [Cypionkella sp.]MDO8984353.1 ImmA/IrrE family metallo-endopeptidase [Cypionkella sp.]MDP1575136.1 ImmA/IrrE family metallo-endopeptidase [Cypionkella sp.]MDP2048026.1 ImmA/IrrE family metallo-endopeptidase [Cypionkella sp.]